MPREFFKDVIRKSCIGPGATEDIFTADFENEILISSPFEQYYSGIVFPSIGKEDILPKVVDIAAAQTEEPEPDTEPSVPDDSKEEGEEEDASGSNEKSGSENADNWAVNHYRDHIGMIFQLDERAKKLEITVSFGRYELVRDLTQKTIKFSGSEKNALDSILEKISESGNYDSLNELSHRLDEVINYNEQSAELHVSSIPEYQFIRIQNQINAQGEAEEIEIATTKRITINDLIRNLNPSEEELDALIKLFLLFKPSFQRIPNYHTFYININEGDISRVNINNDRDLPYYFFKIMESRGHKFAKIIIMNPYQVGESDFHDKITNYHYSLFQCGMSVKQFDQENNPLSVPPYTEIITNSIDEEQNVLEYIYQDVKSYGKGVNCALIWEEKQGEVDILSTSFMPEAEIKDFSLASRPEERYAMNPEVLELKNLSHWGWDPNRLIKELEAFVKSYEIWTEEQSHHEDNNPAKDTILGHQRRILERLQENVVYLMNNKEVRECFQLANTAMYLQMIIARDKRFEKNRDLVFIQNDPDHTSYFNNLDFFRTYEEQENDFKIKASYRPFQLAFLLLNVKPTIDSDDPNRNVVDLIWFPTGGGKTEAYLALTAFTIIARRTFNDNHNGVSVIMRYTLRLLASQQFERASYLICALEFMRNNGLIKGKYPITSGMWVGKGLTPNTVEDLQEKPFNTFTESVRLWQPEANISIESIQDSNPYPIVCCPWCGCKLITKATDDDTLFSGYTNIINGKIDCVNEHCYFGEIGSLPVSFIDKFIYDNPPTLLFGTVDKFAMLSNRAEGHKLFQSWPGDNQLPPDLIIQDELHLISGPLGSMVGLFETIVEALATKTINGRLRKPKIIASTATTRNTRYLIDKLYHRDVSVFPAQGIRHDDNFYSVILNDQIARRKHIGIIPTGKTIVVMEINLVSYMIIAKLKLIAEYLRHQAINLYDKEAILNAIQDDHKLAKDLDDYWTILLYYNSLKDLGRTKSRVPQEIAEKIRAIKSQSTIASTLDFIIDNFYERCDEFTSRAKGAEIKKLLKRAESKIKISEINHENGNQSIRISNEGLDLALASNMISVGIDISRFNLMLFAGQPRSFSEYIQSSSRVARNSKGLVVNLLNPSRNRELSLFENFMAFHQGYYKYVEPLSATPFTENVIDRLLNSLLVCYVRHKLGLNVNEFIIDQHLPGLLELLLPRCGADFSNYVETKLNYFADSWNRKIIRPENPVAHYGPNRDFPNTHLINHTEGDDFDLMMSLRDVEPDCYIQIDNRL